MKPNKVSKPANEVKLTFNKEKVNKYNESYEETLNNIYTLAALMAQVYGRLGYQIKIQEQILAELKKGK